MRQAWVVGMGSMLTWAVAGCGPGLSEGQPAEGGGAPRPMRAEAEPGPPDRPLPDVIAWTAGGDLVIADGVTGAVRSAVPAPGVASDRDVAYDPWQERALVFHMDEGGEGGEIASHAV